MIIGKIGTTPDQVGNSLLTFEGFFSISFDIFYIWQRANDNTQWPTQRTECQTTSYFIYLDRRYWKISSQFWNRHAERRMFPVSPISVASKKSFTLIGGQPRRSIGDSSTVFGAFRRKTTAVIKWESLCKAISASSTAVRGNYRNYSSSMSLP